MSKKSLLILLLIVCVTGLGLAAISKRFLSKPTGNAQDKNSNVAAYKVFATASIVDPQRAASSPRLTHHPLEFRDVTQAAKINWKYSNGATGKHLFIETTGGGVLFFDYNNDGFSDIFAPQGGPVPGAASKSAEQKFPQRNVLYRNNGDGTFSDVTVQAGLGASTGYGQGVSSADYDNDGWADLYVTAYGGNHLFHNNGNGTFSDVSARAGVQDTVSVSQVRDELPWPLGSSWGDYDGDGRLDLFVCHYARWSLALNKPCHDSADRSGLSYCRPQVYQGSHSRLFHNNGDGTFSDVSERAGIARLAGKSMTAVWFDYDDDGKIDLFVTNDTMPNYLLHNNGDGTFTETGMLAGVSMAPDSTAPSGMGVAISDYDHDGREDIFAVNFQSQPKSLFRNLGNGAFDNASYVSNLASTNLQMLGFGLEACDYDLDGWKDLIVGNGHVLEWTPENSNGSSYQQSQQLLHNQGNGTFKDDLRSLGDLVQPRVTRGLAVADYDNDGDGDVAMVAHDKPLQLFNNQGGNAAHWITLRLEGTGRSPRDPVGAQVTIRTSSGAQVASVRGGSSYCSQSDTRLTFGLGEETRVQSVAVRWPDGKRQKIGPLKSNTFYLIRQNASVQLDPRVRTQN